MIASKIRAAALRLWRRGIQRALVGIMNPLLPRGLVRAVVIESHNDFDSNGGAMYDFLIRSGCNSEYTVVLFLHHRLDRPLPPNVKACRLGRPGLRRAYYSCRAEYLFADNDCHRKMRPGQVTVYMSHGIPIKNTSGLIVLPPDTDYCLSPSEFYDPYIRRAFTVDGTGVKMLHFGYPCLDALYDDSPGDLEKLLAWRGGGGSGRKPCGGDGTARRIESDAADTRRGGDAAGRGRSGNRDGMGCQGSEGCGQNDLDAAGKFRRKVIWMPTFRRKAGPGRRNDSDAARPLGVPLIETMEQYDALNVLLGRLDMLLIVKIHPMQDLSDLGIGDRTHIIVLTAADMKAAGVGNWRLYKDMDAMVSDYSSASFDFMHLDRPICYDFSDLQSYRPGLLTDSPEDFLPGERIRDIDALMRFLQSVAAGEDPYAARRREVLNRMFPARGGGSCGRIADFLGIRLHDSDPGI